MGLLLQCAECPQFPIWPLGILGTQQISGVAQQVAGLGLSSRAWRSDVTNRLAACTIRVRFVDVRSKEMSFILIDLCRVNKLREREPVFS